MNAPSDVKGIALTLLLFCAAGAWADERTCTGDRPNAKYAGPMIDAMAQIESAMSRKVSDAFDRAGISRMALFARLHRKRNGESEVLALKKSFPQRFFMGTPKPFDQHEDLSGYFVEKTTAHLRDERYQFVGEILFAHADKAHGEQTQTGERFVAPDGKNVTRLLSALEQRPVPVMLHWEVYDWNRDWPAFHALYSRFPKITFVWPHAGFASHEQVALVLASHDNVVVTLSKKERAKRSLSSEEKNEMLGEPVVDACGRLLREWRDLFAKYPDRFMFATDAHKDHRWARYAEIVEQWRLILGQLPDPLAQSLAWRNAERVYAAPR
jgi:amidohydrolase family protein